MSASSASTVESPFADRRMLNVSATAEQHRMLVEAAEREHSSVSSFVLRSALAAADRPSPKPKKSKEEVMEIIKAAREEFLALNTGRDPLAELLAERRAEAALE